MVLKSTLKVKNHKELIFIFIPISQSATSGVNLSKIVWKVSFSYRPIFGLLLAQIWPKIVQKNTSKVKSNKFECFFIHVDQRAIYIWFEFCKDGLKSIWPNQVQYWAKTAHWKLKVVNVRFYSFLLTIGLCLVWIL